MTDKTNWPDWLKAARTENAQVEIAPTGRVIWLGGVWHDGDWLGGVWHDGNWHDGDWHDGVWRGGVWFGGNWLHGDWHGGVWHGGDWYDGDWYGGVWLGGDWRGGRWLGGNWHGGDDNPTRAPFRVRGSGNIIRVGCWFGTIERAKALCDGGVLPNGAPRRDSPEGDLLRRAVLAQIAWQEAERKT
jgi:hypothetical protein